MSSKTLGQRIYTHRYLYLLILPLLVWYGLFCYAPIYGIQLAFKTYNFSKGITGSPWNNFRNFRNVFSDPAFFRAFFNTCLISLGRLVIEFPMPIIAALMLNEISKYRVKRLYQTIYTFPHFLSWIIMAGIITNLLSDRGLVNQILEFVGQGKNTVLVKPGSFLALIFGSSIWKETGWDSILYLAAITAVNPELYEAAMMDGANRWQQLWVVTWPAVKSTAMILLILKIGNTMNGGFEQIFNMYNPMVYARADIIDTFVYRSAFQDSTGFGYSTAVGLTKSVINFALLYGADRISKKMSGEGLI
jgi:putative aldouronate transport system permease protein